MGCTGSAARGLAAAILAVAVLGACGFAAGLALAAAVGTAIGFAEFATRFAAEFPARLTAELAFGLAAELALAAAFAAALIPIAFTVVAVAGLACAVFRSRAAVGHSGAWRIAGLMARFARGGAVGAPVACRGGGIRCGGGRRGAVIASAILARPSARLASVVAARATVLPTVSATVVTAPIIPPARRLAPLRTQIRRAFDPAQGDAVFQFAAFANGRDHTGKARRPLAKVSLSCTRIA